MNRKMMGKHKNLGLASHSKWNSRLPTKSSLISNMPFGSRGGRWHSKLRCSTANGQSPFAVLWLVPLTFTTATSTNHKTTWQYPQFQNNQQTGKQWSEQFPSTLIPFSLAGVSTGVERNAKRNIQTVSAGSFAQEGHQRNA